MHVLCGVICGGFVTCVNIVLVNALRVCCSAIDALPVDTHRGGGSEMPFFLIETATEFACHTSVGSPRADNRNALRFSTETSKN